MAHCKYCGTFIVLGGVKDQGHRFCSKKCHKKGYSMVLSNEIPLEMVNDYVSNFHKSNCLKCGRVGPMDVRSSYLIISFILYSYINTPRTICCIRCGRKKIIKSMLLSLFFGWWSFPVGVFFTPIQILRNLRALFKKTDSNQPSKELIELLKFQMAEEIQENSGKKIQPL